MRSVSELRKHNEMKALSTPVFDPIPSYPYHLHYTAEYFQECLPCRLTENLRDGRDLCPGSVRGEMRQAQTNRAYLIHCVHCFLALLSRRDCRSAMRERANNR